MAQMRIRFWLGFTAALIAALYFLGPVLTPFFLAILLAYLGDPLIDWLEAHKLARGWAVALVFGGILLLVLLLLLLLIPLFLHQFKGMLQKIPEHLGWLQGHVAPWLHQALGLDPALFDTTELRDKLLSYAKEIGNLAGGVLESLKNSSTVVFTWLANLVLVPVATFYLLRDWDRLIDRMRQLLPRHIEPTVCALARESDAVIGAFLRGQLIVMAALGVMYSTGLALIGLDFSLLIGMLAGLISFVPYLGLIAGILAASIAALLQFHSLLSIVPVIIVFSVGQLISDFLLTPNLVGDRIGLHPVVVMFAVLAGGHLFGFLGILLALPVAAVLAVLLRHAEQKYLASPLYRH